MAYPYLPLSSSCERVEAMPADTRGRHHWLRRWRVGGSAAGDPRRVFRRAPRLDTLQCQQLTKDGLGLDGVVDW
jgi:hypothetical protein